MAGKNESIGAISTQLTLETTQFETNLRVATQKSRQAGAEMSRSMDKARDSFKTTALAVTLLATAATAATLKLGHLVKKQIDVADSTSKSAKAIGMSTEDLSTYHHAADLAGLSNEQFSTAIKQLNKNMMEAGRGTKSQTEAFKALGIEVRKENGDLKSNIELLEEVADAFKDAEDGAGKTAVAMAIFGRAGADMIPLLNGGAEGLRKAQEEARKLRLEISTNTGAAAEEFNDNLTRLKKVGIGLTNEAMAEMLPLLETLSAKMFDSATSSDNLTKKAGALNTALRLLIASGYTIKEVFSGLGELLGSTAAAIEQGLASGGRAMSNVALGMAGKFDEEMAKEGEASAQRGAAIVDNFVEGLGVRARVQQNTFKSIFGDTTKAAVEEVDKSLDEAASGGKKKIDYGDSDNGKSKAKSTVDAINEQIKALKLQAETFGMAEKEATLYKMALDGATQAQLDQADALLTNLAEMNAQKELQEEGVQLYEKTRTELEKLNAELERTNELYEAGAIDMETYNRSMDDINSRIAKLGEDGEDVFKQLQQSIEGWGQQSAQAFADFCTSGEGNFSNLIQSILNDLIKLLAYKTIFEPLFGGLGSLVGGGGGGIGSLVGMAAGIFGGGRATGGPVSAGKMYEINETGIPEILNMGNRQFLMMGQQNGEVIAAGAGEAAQSSGQTPVSVRIMNSLSPDVVDSWAQSATGEQTIMNIITKNNAELKAVLA